MPKKLFAVGDLCVDVLQGMGEEARFGEEQSLRSLHFSIGGNAANFAVIASKLGMRPTLVSVVGSDFATGFLKKELSKAKVKNRLFKSSLPNSFSLIRVDKKGERAILSAKNCLSEITAKKVEKALLPKLSAGDIVFFGGFFHLLNLRKEFIQLLKKIRRKGATVCFDTCFDTTGKWSVHAFLPFIDFLFVNELELKHISKGNSTSKRVQHLFNKGACFMVVKQGKAGATLFAQDVSMRFPAQKTKAVDTTGAGDAFNAGFVFGLMHNRPLDKCMIAGNFVAATKIRQHRLAAPSAKELAKRVKKAK